MLMGTIKEAPKTIYRVQTAEREQGGFVLSSRSFSIRFPRQLVVFRKELDDKIVIFCKADG